MSIQHCVRQLWWRRTVSPSPPLATLVNPKLKQAQEGKNLVEEERKNITKEGELKHKITMESDGDEESIDSESDEENNITAAKGETGNTCNIDERLVMRMSGSVEVEENNLTDDEDDKIVSMEEKEEGGGAKSDSSEDHVTNVMPESSTLCAFCSDGVVRSWSNVFRITT